MKRVYPLFLVCIALCAGVVIADPLPYDYNQEVARVGETVLTRGQLAERALQITGRKLLDGDVKDMAYVWEAARRAGIRVTDEEVNQRINEYKLLLDQFKELVDLIGTANEFAAMPDWLLEDRFRTVLYAEKMLNITVSEAEMKEMYANNLNRFYRPQMAKLVLIVTKKQIDAQKVLDALKDGQDPRALSEKYSTDESIKAIRGDIGWIPYLMDNKKQKFRMMNKEVEEAIFGGNNKPALKAKQWTGIITYQYDNANNTPNAKPIANDYMVFYVEDTADSRERKLNDVRPAVEFLIRYSKLVQAEKEWFEQQYKAMTWKQVTSFADPSASPANPAGNADSAVAPAAYDYNQVVGQVGETKITRGQLAERCIQKVGRNLLEDEFRDKLIMLEAIRRANITVTPEEITTRINNYAMLLKKFPELSDVMGTESAFLATPRWMLESQFRTVLGVEKVLGLKITENDLQRVYAESLGRFYVPPMVKLVLIVTRDLNDARRAWTRLRDGEDVNMLSAKYSYAEDIKAKRGEIGWVSRTQMNEQVDASIFGDGGKRALKPGEFTEIITYVNPDNAYEGSGGTSKKEKVKEYMIYYVRETRPSKDPKYDDVRPAVVYLTRLAKLTSMEEKWFAEQRKANPYQRITDLFDPKATLAVMQ